MGVPGVFLWLWKQYKKSNFVFNKNKLDDEMLSSQVKNIDYLLIDANCLIHPTCFKVLAENPDFKENDAKQDYFAYLLKTCSVNLKTIDDKIIKKICASNNLKDNLRQLENINCD